MEYYESDSPESFKPIISGDGVSSQNTSGSTVAAIKANLSPYYFSGKKGGGVPSGYSAQTLTVCLNGVASTMTVLGTTPVAIQ